MHGKLLLVLDIFLIVLLSDIRSTLCDELNYKIAVPEYICDKDGNVKEIQSDMTTIRFLGKDASVLNYKFNVNFRRIGKSCKNKQRCSMIAWKMVREFEKYLKSYPSSQSGLIQFNNTMLMPGLKYILNITVQNNGTIIEEKQMNLDFVDESVKKSIEKPLASVLLLGSDIVYAYMTYIINAETTICSNITDFYFKWELMDNSNLEIQNLHDKGAELRLPSNIFQGGKMYNINCNLFDLNKNQSIAKGSQSVKVQNRGLLLKMPMINLMTKTNAPINIKAYIVDLDNQDGDIMINWSCIDENNGQCDVNSDTNELNIENGIKSAGKYTISVEASKGEYTKAESCIISVLEDVPSIEIDTIETPISPSSGVEIRVNVDELRAFCSLQWTSIAQSGYEFLDLNALPGNVNELFNVTLKEDLFLNELEELSNGTVNKKFNLLIPPPQGSWQGLKGDTKYLFRLVLSCPSLLEDFNDDNFTDYQTEPLLGDSVVTFADVSIETNSGPTLKPLQIIPTKGEALKTTFNFKTEKANDRAEDSPILYEFGYILDNKYLIFCSMSDVINTNGVLPYSSNDGVQTFLRGCDNFNSCSKVLGPVIKTDLPKNLDTRTFMHSFKEYLNTDDFSKAVVYALSVLKTCNSFNNNETSKEIQGLFSNEINNKIVAFINSENKENYWIKSANKMIKYINEFNDYLTFSEDILNNIVKLRSMLSDKSNLLQSIVPSGRKLLSHQNIKEKLNYDLNLEDIKSYLQVSELIITSSSNKEKIETEKERLRKKLSQYMEKSCNKLYSKYQDVLLEMKTVIATVEKLNRNSFINFITIPFEGNSWQINAKIKLNGAFKTIVQNNRFCISRAVFRDYFGKNGFTYFAKLYEANGKDIPMSGISVNIYLPIDKDMMIGKKPICMVYDKEWKNNCKLLKIIPRFIQCSCQYLGYYSIGYEVINSTNSTVFSLTTSSINAIVTNNIKENSVSTINTVTAIDNQNDGTTSNINKILNITNTTELNNANYEVLSYIIITSSLVGIGILCFILRRILSTKEDRDVLMDDFDSPKYATFYNEELLTGCT